MFGERRLKNTSCHVFGYIVSAIKFNQVDYYGTLITGVHEKYGSAGVIMLSRTSQLSFERLPIWHKISRMLSDAAISTLVTKFGQFSPMLKSHIEKDDKPLLVVAVLHSIEEYRYFEIYMKSVDTSDDLWLILFPPNANRDVCQLCHNPLGNAFNLKFNSKVLISCCESRTIQEWWSIDKTHVRTHNLARLFDDNLEVVWTCDVPRSEGRYSLEGRGLRVVTLKVPRSEDKDQIYEGFLGSVLKEIALAMNFTVSKVIWETDHGVLDPGTSKWSGAIGRIQRGEADIGIAMFYMTTEYNTAVDYTSPLISSAFQVHLKKLDAAHLSLNAYYKVFSIEVWIVILMLILITPLLSTLREYKKAKNNVGSLLSEHYLGTWGIYCGQGSADFAGGPSLRMIYLSLFASALVVLNAYSATMMSFIAVSSSYKPFTTLAELVDDGTYKLIAMGHDVAWRKSSRNPITKKMIPLLKPQQALPKTFMEGFQQVCNGNVGFLASDRIKKVILHQLPCKIVSISTGKIDSAAWIMPRGSELRDAFNHYIQGFKSNGISQQLDKRFLMDFPESEDHTLAPVYLEQVFPLIFILAIGFLISMVFLLVEVTYSRRNPLRKRMRRAIHISKTVPSPMYPYCN